MYCKKCGKSIKEDDVFCDKCGFNQIERAWFSLSDDEKHDIKKEFNRTFKKNPGINAGQWILSIIFMLLLFFTVGAGFINDSGLNDVSSTTIILGVLAAIVFIIIIVIEIVSRVSRSNNFTIWLKTEKNIIK